jgi:hypothetical protein
VLLPATVYAYDAESAGQHLWLGLGHTTLQEATQQLERWLQTQQWSVVEFFMIQSAGLGDAAGHGLHTAPAVPFCITKPLSSAFFLKESIGENAPSVTCYSQCYNSTDQTQRMEMVVHTP